jgi:hypothetical protein
MAASSKYDLAIVPRLDYPIVQNQPESPPQFIEPWLAWEYSACLFTDGIKFTTKDLHDVIKSHINYQNLPVNIFYSEQAHWVIEGAFGQAKVDNDRRPRVSANIKNSRHSDMYFITGIDNFGDCWANFQMMILVQPRQLDRPAKPVVPKPILPTEALIVLAVLAIIFLVSNNQILIMFGLLGLIGGGLIWVISSQNVREAKEQLERWKEDISKIELEELEIRKNRLSRSFQSDDLFTFHEVMTKITSSIIFHTLLKKGGKIEESNERNLVEDVIPKSKKDMFDEF